MANQYKVAKGTTMKRLIGKPGGPASPLLDVDAPTNTSLRAEGAGNTVEKQERARRISRISGRYGGARYAPKEAAAPMRDADLSKLMASLNMPKHTSELLIDTDRESALADYFAKAFMAGEAPAVHPSPKPGTGFMTPADIEADKAVNMEGSLLAAKSRLTPKVIREGVLESDTIETIMAAYDRARHGKRTYGEGLKSSDAVARARFKARAMNQQYYAEMALRAKDPATNYSDMRIAEEEEMRLAAIERFKAEGKEIPEILKEPRTTYSPKPYDPFARQMAASGDVEQFDNPAVFGGMVAAGVLSPFTTLYKMASGKTEDEYTPVESALTFLSDMAFGMGTMSLAGASGAASKIGAKALPYMSEKAANAAGHIAAAAAFEVPQWVPQFYVAGGGDPVKGVGEVFRGIANSFNPLFYMDPNVPAGVKTASAMQAGLLSWGAWVGGNATIAKYREKRLAIAAQSPVDLTTAGEIAVMPMGENTGAAFNAGNPGGGAVPVRLLADGEPPKPGEKVVHLTDTGKLAEGEPLSGRDNEAPEAEKANFKPKAARGYPKGEAIDIRARLKPKPEAVAPTPQPKPRPSQGAGTRKPVAEAPRLVAERQKGGGKELWQVAEWNKTQEAIDTLRRLATEKRKEAAQYRKDNPVRRGKVQYDPVERRVLPISDRHDASYQKLLNEAAEYTRQADVLENGKPFYIREAERQRRDKLTPLPKTLKFNYRDRTHVAGKAGYIATNVDARTEAALGGRVAMVPGETQALHVVNAYGDSIRTLGEFKSVDTEGIQAIKDEINSPRTAKSPQPKPRPSEGTGTAKPTTEAPEPQPKQPVSAATRESVLKSAMFDRVRRKLVSDTWKVKGLIREYATNPAKARAELEREVRMAFARDTMDRSRPIDVETYDAVIGASGDEAKGRFLDDVVSEIEKAFLPETVAPDPQPRPLSGRDNEAAGAPTTTDTTSSPSAPPAKPDADAAWKKLQDAEAALADVARRNGEARTRAVVDEQRIKDDKAAQDALNEAKAARDKAKDEFEAAREPAVDSAPDLDTIIENVLETLKSPEDAINDLKSAGAPIKGRQKPKGGRRSRRGGSVDLGPAMGWIISRIRPGKVTGNWKPTAAELERAHAMIIEASELVLNSLRNPAIEDPARYMDAMSGGVAQMSNQLRGMLTATISNPDTSPKARVAAQTLLDNPIGAEVAMSAALGDSSPLAAGLREWRSVAEAIDRLGDDASGLKEFVGKVLFPAVVKASARANMLVAGAQTVAKSLSWSNDMAKRLAVGKYLNGMSNLDEAANAGDLPSDVYAAKSAELREALGDSGLDADEIDRDIQMLRNYMNTAHSLVGEGYWHMTGDKSAVGNRGPRYWTRAYGYQTPWSIFADQLSGRTRMRSTNETFGYAPETGGGDVGRSVIVGRQPAALKQRTRQKGVPMEYDAIGQFVKYMDEMANEAAYFEPMRLATGLLDAVNNAALARKNLQAELSGERSYLLTTEQAAAATTAMRNRYLEKRGATSRSPESIFNDPPTDKGPTTDELFNTFMDEAANELWGDTGKGQGDLADLVSDMFARATGLDVPEAYPERWKNVLSNASVIGGRAGANLTRANPGTMLAQIGGLVTQAANSADISHTYKLLFNDKALNDAMGRSSILKLNEHGPRLDTNAWNDIKSGVFKDAEGGLRGFMRRMFNSTAAPAKGLSESGSFFVRGIQETLDRMAWAAIYQEALKMGTAIGMDPVEYADARFSSMYPRSGASAPRVYKNPNLAMFTSLTSEPFASAKSVGRALIGKRQPYDVSGRRNRAARMIGAAVMAHGANMLSRQMANRNVSPVDPLGYLEDSIAMTEDNEIAREIGTGGSDTVYTGINTVNIVRQAAAKFAAGDTNGGLRILSVYPEQLKVAPIATVVDQVLRPTADFASTVPVGSLGVSLMDDEFRRVAATGSPYEYGATSPMLGWVNDIGRIVARGMGQSRNTDADTERLSRTTVRMLLPWAMVAVRAADAARFEKGDIINPNANEKSHFNKEVFHARTGRYPNGLELFLATTFGPEVLDEGKQYRRLEQAKKTKAGLYSADRKVKSWFEERLKR